MILLHFKQTLLKFQIKAFGRQRKAIRRNSVFSVSIGGKAFSPKFTEGTECRREKLFDFFLSLVV